MTQDNMTFNHSIYHRETSSIDHEQCSLIGDYFYKTVKEDSSLTNKTHLFHGRYENIYLKNNTYEPLINALLDAKNIAAKIIKCNVEELSMDFWFNDMPPTHITTWHTHDVLNERLSGVFYVKIPDNSGNLLLKHKGKIKCVHPKENDFVFFPPDNEHQVEENKSSQSRLSIGMNFGFLADKEEN